MKRFVGKVAVLTVDEHGLTDSIAKAFVLEGSAVAIADSNETRLAALTQALSEQGIDSFALLMNPYDATSCEQGVAQVMARYGRLDIVCNLIGDFSRSRPLHEIELQDYERVVAANITSVLLLSRFAMPAIRSSGGHGAIINVSHTAALDGIPGTCLLAATKGALLNMTRNMALQGHQQGFRVNCVCVGDSFAPVIPSLLHEHAQRKMAVEALAPTFVYLASDESRHVNGHILLVDDGSHAWIESPTTPPPHTETLPEPVFHTPPTFDPTQGYMADRVVLITGAGGGIGRACAKLFASEGAKLALADLNGESAQSLATEICDSGGEAIAIAANALREDDCARVVGDVVRRFGRLDGLINLVGYFGTAEGSLEKVPLAEWNWMMDINLKSVFMMSRSAIPALINAGGGSIVNIGTLAAVIARGHSHAYGTSKAGVLSLTRAMAADYVRQNIRVNAVCPSATDTAMYTNVMSKRVSAGGELEQVKNEMRRSDQGLSRPEEIAPSFLYLASNGLSPKVTGHILMTDNGFSMMRR